MSAPAASAALARRIASSKPTTARESVRAMMVKSFELGGIGGGADLGDVVVAADQLLVVEMAALLREHLVLDMDGGDAGALELLHGADTR